MTSTAGAMVREVRVTVNGTARSARTEVRTTLSDFLRHGLGLTGTHVGCEEGVCGSCTVLLDGEPVRACLMLAVQAEGRTVETVEGLAENGELDGMQRALRDAHGLQCGFCTPGILMSLTAAEREGLSAEEAAGPVLAGHRCRCTGYAGIRAAIERRWRNGRGDGHENGAATGRRQPEASGDHREREPEPPSRQDTERPQTPPHPGDLS